MWEGEGLSGKGSECKFRSETSVGFQGRDGDSLDLGVGQYPEHAEL